MAADPAKGRSMPVPRTPRAVINEAIRETAPYETICWWGLVIFGLTGVITILLAVLWRGDWAIGAVGTVPTALCWPAIHYAISIRRGNIALRMLELALNNVKSSEEALKAINQAFGFYFGPGEIDANVVQESEEKAPRGSP